MPQLPHDIVTDILLRLSAKSLVRFGCVCKVWHSLITSNQFIGMHLNHATDDKYNNRHKVILSANHALQFLHYGKSNANVEWVDFPLKCLEGFKVVGSCNGLLCIVIYNGSIAIGNPSTREYKKLPLVSCLSGDTQVTKDLFGFGYDSSVDDYKVVRIRCGARLGNSKGTPVKICSLKTNSWKNLVENIPSDIYFPYQIPEQGMHVNGALYWCLSDTQLGMVTNYNFNDGVLRFDLLDEKFMVLPLPHDVAHKAVFSLGVFGGYLCLVQNHHKSGVEMWALKEDNMKFLWSKMVTIPRMEGMRSNGLLSPISFMKNGEVLMSTRRNELFSGVIRQKKFYLYNPEGKTTFIELLIRGSTRYFWNEVTTYIESLVSPNGVETER